jgi:hypothetical protein
VNRTIIVPTAALACLCVHAHAQLVTYDVNDQMALSGSASMHTSAYSYLVSPSGCFPPDSNDSASHPTQYTGLYPSGNSDNFFDTLTASVTTCSPYALVQGNYIYMVTGTATNSSVHATYAGDGRLYGEAMDDQPPCQMGLTSGSYEGLIGSGPHSVYIPFHIETECFMKLDTQAFYLGDTPGDLVIEWSTNLPCSPETLIVSPGDALDVTAALCCVPEGDYYMQVTITASHEVGERVSCSNQYSEQGGPMALGFTVNANFQDYCSCPGDVNNDGVVDVDDYIAVIVGWGACPISADPCPADVDHDGDVDNDDLILVITEWGECECCL